jgi:hypothetical protein
MAGRISLDEMRRSLNQIAPCSKESFITQADFENLKAAR